MNNEKIAKYIQNIFHLENMTADNDSYNRGSISSNSWGNGITIRWTIRDFSDEKEVIIKYVYSMGSYNINIDSGMTAKEASKEIVDLIGRVLITQADTVDPNTGMNNILSWPYNCNLAYVQYVIESLQYGDNPIENSRRPIKSDYHNKEIYREAFASLVKDSDAQDFDNSPYGTVHYPGFYRVLVDGTYETEFSAETDEEAIQKFKDYFAQTRGIRNSKKSIKSSFDILYDYIDKGVFWEDVEDYADQLIQEGEFTLDEYNREKGKLREYFNNEEKKAKKTSWENEGRENGFLNNSKKSIKSYRDTSNDMYDIDVDDMLDRWQQYKDSHPWPDLDDTGHSEGQSSERDVFIDNIDWFGENVAEEDGTIYDLDDFMNQLNRFENDSDEAIRNGTKKFKEWFQDFYNSERGQINSSTTRNQLSLNKIFN